MGDREILGEPVGKSLGTTLAEGKEEGESVGIIDVVGIMLRVGRSDGTLE